MSETYSYNHELATQLDYARMYLGDVEDPWLLSNETITNALSRHGWSQGMFNLVQGLISRAAQEPVKYDEGQGSMVDFTGRLAEWNKLKRDFASGKIPDPFSTNNSTIGLSRSITAQNEPTW